MPHKVWLIFRREYAATVKTKAFVVALLLLPLMMVFGIILPLITPLIADEDLETRPHTCAVADRSGENLLSALAARADQLPANSLSFQLELIDARDPSDASESRAQVGQRLSDGVRRGALDCFVELDASLATAPGRISTQEDLTADGPRGEIAPSPIRYYALANSSPKLRGWFETHLNQLLSARRLEERGIDSEIVRELTSPIRVDVMDLYESGAQVAPQLADPLTRFGFSIAASLLMFMAVMLGAGPLMQSVLEEKMQRIAEILISSVPPFQLMLGKLLAASAVSLTLTSIYFACSMLMAQYLGHVPDIGITEVVWMLVFQIVALFMYGSVFLAVGSACSDLKATQTLMMPVMVVATLPMLLLHVVVMAPNSNFSVVASLVPFFTPVLMFVRVTLSPAPPLWQPLLGIALSGLTALVCVYVAGRIFRIGMLSQGSAPRFADLKRWFFER